MHLKRGFSSDSGNNPMVSRTCDCSTVRGFLEYNLYCCINTNTYVWILLTTLGASHNFCHANDSSL